MAVLPTPDAQHTAQHCSISSIPPQASAREAAVHGRPAARQPGQPLFVDLTDVGLTCVKYPGVGDGDRLPDTPSACGVWALLKRQAAAIMMRQNAAATQWWLLLQHHSSSSCSSCNLCCCSSPAGLYDITNAHH
jgi:hypothetical protein